MREFNFKSKEFFRNLTAKDIPPKSHKDYLALRDWEIEKCKNGINVNGVHIWGSLYYHLNHQYLDADKLDSTGRNIITIELPTLRDNEWIMHEAYNQAVAEKKSFILGSGRQASKSSMLVSLVTRELFLFQNSEVVGTFSSKADKETFNKKLLVSLQNNTEFLVVPNIDKDLTKTFIRFGVKGIDNEDFVFSKLYTYLTDGGNNTEVTAGKALEHGTKVYYADKEGVIEDCKVGDRVYGRDGKLTTILGVYPQGEVDMYKITFSDGRTVNTCGEHLWEVESKTPGKRKKIKTTKELFLAKTKYNPFYVKNCKPVEYSEKSFLIPPYVLAYHLGDGDSKGGRFCSTDPEPIIEYKKSYEVTDLKDDLHYYAKGLVTDLRALNVYDNKHIPEEYFYGSVQQRIDFIAGLLDSDGNVQVSFTKSGRKNTLVGFTNTNKNLVEGIMRMYRSLGGNCSVHSRQRVRKGNLNKISYEVILWNTPSFFKILRKKNLIVPSVFQKNRIAISKIEKIDRGLATCITVDNSDHLFLVNDYIPTHNSPSFYFSDEVAKHEFLEVHEAMMPGLRGKYGMRSPVCYFFTGGDVEKSKDAEKIFRNPKAFDFKEYDEGCGKFLSGIYRSDLKKESTFGEFVKDYLGKVIDVPEFNSLPMLVTDEEEANKILDKEEEEAKKISLAAYTKRKMYNPRSINDIFLRANDNPFAHLYSELEKLLHFLENTAPAPSLVDLTLMDGNVAVHESSKPLLTQFPSYKLENWEKDAAFAIVDKPRLIPGVKLYVAGNDPFNTIKTSESASLGSFYIMRRGTTDYSDPYSNRIVAWYNGRKDITHFRKLLLAALTYYGGEVGGITMLHEAADDTLTQHFSEKGKMYMLEDTYTLSREINPGASSFNTKGLRPTVNNQKFMISALLDYLEEELPDGRLGLWRIPDPYVIKQIMQYDGDLSDKDSVVALSHAIVHLNKERKYTPYVATEEEHVKETRSTRSIFGTSGGRRSLI